MKKAKIARRIFTVALPFLLIVSLLGLPNGANVYLGTASAASPGESDIDFTRPKRNPVADNATAKSFRFPLDGSWSVALDFGDATDSGTQLGEDVYRPEGTRVYSSADGIVRFAGQADGYGAAAVVEHVTGSETVCTFYGHLSLRLGLEVSPGLEVSKGQLIGYLAYDDEDGGDWSPHLHFGIRKGPHQAGWDYYDCDPPGNIADWYDPTDFISGHQEKPQEESLVSPSDGSYQGRVYWLQNGNLYWVTEYVDNDSNLGATIDGMSSLPGWGWDKMNEFSSDLLVSYSGWPDGVARFIATDSESNGLLISDNKSADVYLTDDGKKLWFPDSAAVEYAGYSMADVIIVTEEVVNLFLETSDDAEQIGRSSTVVVAPGESFSIWVATKNTGTSVWTEGLQYCLGWRSGLESFPNSESLQRITLGLSDNITPDVIKHWTMEEITAPSSPGTYTIVWQMVRENVYWFGDSANIQITVVKRTDPPYTPSTPSGPRCGYTETSYSYSTSTTDPDGDEIKYTFDWGDGTSSETDYVSSDTPVRASHIWSNPGTYDVRAKATDSNGASSGWSSPQTVVIDSLPTLGPSAPTLISPANGSTVPSTSVTFKWNPRAGADKYFLEVNTSSSWDEETRKFYGEVDDVTKTMGDIYLVVSGNKRWFADKAAVEDAGYTMAAVTADFSDDGTTYYWRVKARNTSGWGYWAATWSFINMSQPSAPTLSSPDAADKVAGRTVTFQWTAPSEETVTKYLLEVYTDPDLGEVTRKFYGDVGNVTEYSDTGYPNDGTAYYWRVRAGNDAGWGPPSLSRTFISTAPILSSPADRASASGTSVTFEWEALVGATKYLLEVNEDPGWDEEKSKFFDDVGNVTEYEDTGYPNDGIVYYWRVRAGNDAGWISRSETWSFTNSSVAKPSAPTLSSPKETDGVTAQISGTSVTFTWGASTGANNYWLEVNTSSSWGEGTRKFLGNVGDVTQYEDTGYPDNGTTYYWRVRACNASGCSSWSEGESFINTSRPAPTLTSPEDGAEVAGTSVTFTWGASTGADNYWLEVNAKPDLDFNTNPDLLLGTGPDYWGKATRMYRGDVGNVLSKIVTGFPDDGTKYYWRVRARSDAGWSCWSDNRTFTNGTFTELSAPTLSSPADGATVPGTSVTFTWTALAGAYRYQLEVNSSSFWEKRTRKYRGNADDVTKTVTRFSNDGTRYYWRVRARNAAGWSDWAQSRTLINGPP